MADNYLEKRYEETLGQQRPKVKRVGNTVDTLLRKNRSTRGYNIKYIVSEQELRRILKEQYPDYRVEMLPDKDYTLSRSATDA